MTRRELNDKIFVGVVEDNLDPKKLGRCKVRVLNVFDDIAVEDIPWASPWKDLNGNQFLLPEISKVVSVVFDEGNIYKPEYIYAEHYNANLEKKLSELSGSDYTSMRALMFDHKTQIYSNDSEGLKMDYKCNNINITNSTIDMNLKDNFSNLNLGSNTATQQAVLGNHFFNWFDKFINTLVLNGHLGNLMAPIQPTPEMLQIMEQYYSLRDEKFLSDHVNIVDNNYVNLPTLFEALTGQPNTDDRITVGQTGDNWKSTVKSNTGSGIESTSGFTPNQGLKTDTPSGTLTTSSSENGVAPVATDPGPISPSTHQDAIRIIETMKKKGYVILTRPYEMNIVGIRRQYEGMVYSNKFVDSMYLIFKTDVSDKWEVKQYPCSTMPGLYPGAKETLLKKYGGMGILKPAQYLNTYKIGIFPEKYKTAAMITLGTQKAYRDLTTGNIITYSKEIEGYFGMLIHRGYPGGGIVNNWSEGCQVFGQESHLLDFFKWCNMHKDKYKNVFNYTLMEERDLVVVKPQTSQSSSTNSISDNFNKIFGSGGQ
jgi:hypothetical protein